MLGHLEVMLSGIVAESERQITELSILTDAEERQILEEFNRTRAGFSNKKCLHRLFEEQVERTPTGVAVEHKGRRLTYQELHRRANQLAHHLRRQGVGPEVLVGICVERGLEMI